MNRLTLIASVAAMLLSAANLYVLMRIVKQINAGVEKVQPAALAIEKIAQELAEKRGPLPPVTPPGSTSKDGGPGSKEVIPEPKPLPPPVFPPKP
jgi:hypothetical protein